MLRDLTSTLLEATPTRLQNPQPHAHKSCDFVHLLLTYYHLYGNNHQNAIFSLKIRTNVTTLYLNLNTSDFYFPFPGRQLE